MGCISLSHTQTYTDTHTQRPITSDDVYQQLCMRMRPVRECFWSVLLSLETAPSLVSQALLKYDIFNAFDFNLERFEQAHCDHGR